VPAIDTDNFHKIGETNEIDHIIFMCNIIPL
jgi:hypothetical protein